MWEDHTKFGNIDTFYKERCSSWLVSVVLSQTEPCSIFITCVFLWRWLQASPSWQQLSWMSTENAPPILMQQTGSGTLNVLKWTIAFMERNTGTWRAQTDGFGLLLDTLVFCQGHFGMTVLSKLPRLILVSGNRIPLPHNMSSDY